MTSDLPPPKGEVHKAAASGPLASSPDGVVGRALSTSFIAALDDTIRTALLDDIRDVVEPLGQKFDYPYRSELQAWRLG